MDIGEEDTSDDDEPPMLVPGAAMEPSAAAPMSTERAGCVVPVTLLTGWLGSGKTTLLNFILHETHGKRIAVIENEFAEGAGIENSMVTGADGEIFEEFYELPNGCICCSVRSDFVAALETLMQKRHKFDYILIESTGLADPGPIASSLWLDKQLEATVALDAIVSVVDAKHILHRLNEVKPEGTLNEAARQIAFADVLLVNKMDLVSDEEAKAVIDAIRQLNQMAKLITCQRCKVDLDSILNIGAYDLERAKTIDPAAFGLVPASETPALEESGGNKEEMKGNAARASHEASIKSVFIEEAGSVDLTKFNYWMGDLLWERGEIDIFRMKAIMAIKGEDRRFMFQGVATLFDSEPAQHWGDEELRTCKMVFIGKSLDANELRKGLRGCMEASIFPIPAKKGSKRPPV